MKRQRQLTSRARPVKSKPLSLTQDGPGSKVGLTVARPDAESSLSPEFGLTGWVLICRADGQEPIIERNPLLYGKGVIDILARYRCTDVIFSTIGPGGLQALKAAGIRGWCGPESVPATKLSERLKLGGLRRRE